MKLRARFPRLQLLFLLGLSAALIAESRLRADTVVTSDGQKREMKVLGVSGANLQVQIGSGTLGLPLATVKEVQMLQPPEVVQAQNALVSKQYDKALPLIKSLADKYQGIPVDWARQVSGMLGDLYIRTGDLSKAETAYKDFQRLYPNGGSAQADVGMARIAISKKDFATAKAKLQPIAEAALKDKNVSSVDGYTYSNAFAALGEVEEHDGNLPAALEDYLRTVTLFYHDPSAVSLAQEKADALKAQKITVP